MATEKSYKRTLLEEHLREVMHTITIEDFRSESNIYLNLPLLNNPIIHLDTALKSDTPIIIMNPKTFSDLIYKHPLLSQSLTFKHDK